MADTMQYKPISGLNETSLNKIIEISKKELAEKSYVDAAVSNLATKSELGAKVDKVEGKGLSTEDFTTEYKNKLEGLSNTGVSDEQISTAVNNYMQEHPVSSGATAEQVAQIQANKTAIGDANSGLTKEINDIKNTELQNLNAAIQTLDDTLGDKSGLPSGDENVIASINRIDNKPSGTVTNEQISTAVNNYLTEHPVSSGATAEQAAQIEANRTAIGDSNSGLIKEVNNIKNTELQNLNTAIQRVNETVGNKSELPSGDANVIASINRIDSKPSGTVTDEQISTAVNNYLTEHPVSGTLTPEQTAAINKVKNSVFINAESTSDNVTASDTTKVVEIAQKEVNNFRIPSLTPLSYASNPIITKDIVNDYEGVTGTADPFITKKDGVYYCFFELSTGNVNTSTLGYAYSYDAITWTYGSKLSGLETRCAFPNVKLDSNGEWYMIPDTSANLDVYKAVNFPSVWQKEYTLLNGKFADTDIIKIGDIYYMFTMEVGSNLNCYYNESGDWKNTSWVKHPQSPVLQAPGMRLAGNIIVNDDGSAVVPCQGTQTGQYGEKTTFYQFTNFSKTSISISNGVTALTGSKGMWDGIAIHQISTLKCNNGNLYVVDGLAPGGKEEYSIGIYTDGDKQEIATSDITVPSINNSDWNDVDLTKVIDSDYMINGGNIKIVSSGVYLVNIQVGADKFRINNKGVPILKGIKNGTKILYLKKNDILTVQIYNSTNSLDNNYTSFIDVIKLS